MMECRLTYLKQKKMLIMISAFRNFLWFMLQHKNSKLVRLLNKILSKTSSFIFIFYFAFYLYSAGLQILIKVVAQRNLLHAVKIFTSILLPCTLHRTQGKCSSWIKFGNSKFSYAISDISVQKYLMANIYCEFARGITIQNNNNFFYFQDGHECSYIIFHFNINILCGLDWTKNKCKRR